MHCTGYIQATKLHEHIFIRISTKAPENVSQNNGQRKGVSIKKKHKYPVTRFHNTEQTNVALHMTQFTPLKQAQQQKVLKPK